MLPTSLITINEICFFNVKRQNYNAAIACVVMISLTFETSKIQNCPGNWDSFYLFTKNL